MYKVIAFWHGDLKEAIFAHKFEADEFVFRLVAYDLSTCPRTVKI